MEEAPLLLASPTRAFGILLQWWQLFDGQAGGRREAGLMAGPAADISFGTGVTGARRDAATEAQVDPAPGVLAPVPELAETRHRGGGMEVFRWYRGTQLSQQYGDTQVSLWYRGT